MSKAVQRARKGAPAPVGEKKHLVSALTVTKAEEGEKERVIEGIASTPNADRMGDVVVPTGAKYTLPIKLLWQHRHDQPIGEVEWAEVTKDGIRFRARLAKSDRPGRTKDRLDEAWESIELGLTAHVSIGFRSLKTAWLDDGGIEFMEWEWFELSVVTIPANADASIETVRALDDQLRAASGRSAASRPSTTKASTTAAGAAFTPAGATPASSRRKDAVTYEEQRNALQRTLEQKQARQKEITEATARDGRTKDDDEREEFDQLRTDIKAIRTEIEDLDDLIEDETASTKAKAKTATAVKTVTTEERVHRGGPVIISRGQTKAEDKGLDFARYAMCVAVGGNKMNARQLAEEHYGENERVLGFAKAAVGAHQTDGGGSAPIAEAQTLVSEFLEVLFPMTLVGRLGMNGVAAPRRVPFNKKVPRGTSAGSAGFVGQGKPIKVGRHAFDLVELGITKIGSIAIVSNDLLDFGNIDAEREIRDNLIGSTVETLDTVFADPSVAAVASTAPGSIFNGLTPIASSGSDAEAVSRDIASLVLKLVGANHNAAGAVVIMSQTQALRISSMRSALGVREFPEMGPNGGVIDGYAVLASATVPDGVMGALSARDLLLARSDAVSIELSKEASIEMDDAPTQDGSAGTGASLVSLFQNDLCALRSLHHVNWRLGYPTAASVITDAAYNAPAEPEPAP